MDTWDKIYQKEGRKYVSSLSTWPTLLAYLKNKKAKKILDLGCGTGGHLLALARLNYQTYGLDISPEAIKIAKKSFAKEKFKGHFHVGSMHDPLPFPDNFFDAVISLRAFNHGRFNEIQKTANEVKRVVRPGGLVFISVIKSFGRKNFTGEARHDGLKLKFIEPRTYIPLHGKEKGVVHFCFNKAILLKMFKDMRLEKFWLDYGSKKWERYYCALFSKKILTP